MNAQPSTTLETLWQALVTDPNDLNRLTSWIQQNERLSGDLGAKLALERAASLPSSWLAKIWLTRALLAEDKLDEAMGLYREALCLAPRKSLAVQEISGHLGEAGYYREAIDFLLPIYSPENHGPYAGFNLFNACEDIRDWDAAQEVLDRMGSATWPDAPGSRQFKEIVRIRQKKLHILRAMRVESNAAFN